MTTGVQDRVGSGRSVAGEDAVRPGGRWAQWWASWRVAVRMARRDVRRHKGRSALIALMVGLPVLALVGGGAIGATGQVDHKEMLRFELGDAQASLFYSPGNTQAVQDAVMSGWAVNNLPGAPAQPIPGMSTGHEAAALSALTGGTVTAVTNSRMSVDVGASRLRLNYLGLDGAGFRQSGDRARLNEGRWPRSPDEVIVTEAGVRHGLPRTGQLTMRDADVQPSDPRTVTIVGVGSGFTRSYESLDVADLIGLPFTQGSFETQGPEYLVARDRPIDPDELRRLNQHGIFVLSRAVIEDDAAVAALKVPQPDGLFSGLEQDVQWAGFAAMGGVGLLLLTSLLAGPAFAVTAARQRRTLALAASNGANRAQLRRTVLGQALVLGMGSAVLAMVVGLTTAWASLPWMRSRWPETFYGPFDVPWLAVTVTVVAAVVSSVISALVPSRGLGKLDIVSVLRGQSVSPRLRRRTPVIGLVIAIGGAAVTLWAATADSPNSMAAGSVVLVVGTLLMVPLLLTWIARAVRRAPFSVRVATRDAARHRGRATPTVAAILAGAAALSTFMVLVASDTAIQDKYYRAQLPAGYGEIRGSMSITKSGAAVHGISPTTTVHGMWQVSPPPPAQSGDDPVTTPADTVIGALRTGCTPADLVSRVYAMSSRPCHSLSTMSQGDDGYDGMAVTDAAYAAAILRLDDRERAALAQGSMLVIDGLGERDREVSLGDGARMGLPGSATVDVVDGKVRIATVPVDLTTEPRVQGTPTVVDVPALALHRDRFRVAFPNGSVGAVMTLETAKAHGLTTEFASVVLQPGPDGISPDLQAEIDRAVRREQPDTQTYVERGFQRGDLWLVVGGGGVVGFIILVATLIATALGQAEGQSMSGTLAAVGATRLTRRNLAAAQAGALAVLGAALGALVGLVPGVALAWQTSTTHWMSVQRGDGQPIVVVPWLQLLIPVVIIPLIAAALAWVSIRKHPTVTRRLT